MHGVTYFIEQIKPRSRQRKRKITDEGDIVLWSGGYYQ